MRAPECAFRSCKDVLSRGSNGNESFDGRITDTGGW